MKPLTAAFALTFLSACPLPADEPAAPARIAEGTGGGLSWVLEAPAGGNPVIVLTERTGRQPPVRLTAPAGTLRVSVSPDGKKVLAATRDAQLHYARRPAEGPWPDALTPAGTTLAAQVRTAAGSDPAAPWKTRSLEPLAWSPDSRLVLLSLTGEGGGISLAAHLCVLDPAAAPDAPLPSLTDFQALTSVPWPKDSTPDAVPYKSLGYADGLFTREGKPFTGTTTDRFPSGLLRRRYHLADGVFHGLIEEWYDTGHQKARTEYEHGKHQGSNIYWNADGSLQVQKFWENDVLVKEEKAP